VLTFHGSDINTWPDEYPDRIADLRAATREAATVFAVSRALAERVEAVTGTPAVHLPLGSDHRSLAASAIPRSEARAELGLPQDRIVALFVGNLKASKGVHEFADAILALGSQFHGVLIGGGSETGYGALDPRAAGRLEYRGPQPHEDAIRYMSAADVLVLPSHGEGLPTVLVEAGSLGLPVIASRIGGVPELLGSDRGALLADISSEAVVVALRHFADHRPAAQAMADRLHDLVVRDYDVDRNAARLLDFYRVAAPGLPVGTEDRLVPGLEPIRMR
jgi:teichuronic acid biosynthesis glycosyltransferase TuaC